MVKKYSAPYRQNKRTGERQYKTKFGEWVHVGGSSKGRPHRGGIRVYNKPKKRGWW